ncbi:MAG: phosphotransferase [Lachnospiraceae bacterium]|nr:phosphotransferase [Lachnospiraceae bacterium]
MDIKELKIISEYIDEPVLDITEIHGGHINKTFLVTAKDKYVLQCLNYDLYSEYTDILTDNYFSYKNACDMVSNKDNWNCPEWLMAKNGQFFYCDDNIWRMYRYIPGDNKIVDSYKTGEGLGKLHRILSYCNNIKPVHSHLYDLNNYYEQYININGNNNPRIDTCDKKISDNIDKMLSIKDTEINNIHGDAKAGNMIINEGKVIGFIDFDTLMPGSVLNDMADCMRSCCSNKKYILIEEKVKGFLDGYSHGFGKSLSDDRIKLLHQFYKRNRFMLGLRYYTDYLKGNIYFKENNPGDNLNKAKMLLM